MMRWRNLCGSLVASLTQSNMCLRSRAGRGSTTTFLWFCLRRRDGLSVRAATRKASALTIGKAIRLFPQSENTLRKRYQRDCKTLGVQMLLESTKELSIEKLESLVPNVSRAFRLTTETQCDAIFPAEDSFPPGAPCRWPVKPRTCLSIVPNALD